MPTRREWPIYSIGAISGVADTPPHHPSIHGMVRFLALQAKKVMANEGWRMLFIIVALTCVFAYVSILTLTDPMLSWDFPPPGISKF